MTLIPHAPTKNHTILIQNNIVDIYIVDIALKWIKKIHQCLFVFRWPLSPCTNKKSHHPHPQQYCIYSCSSSSCKNYINVSLSLDDPYPHAPTKKSHLPHSQQYDIYIVLLFWNHFQKKFTIRCIEVNVPDVITDTWSLWLQLNFITPSSFTTTLHIYCRYISLLINLKKSLQEQLLNWLMECQSRCIRCPHVHPRP